MNNVKHVEIADSSNVWDSGYGTTKDIGYGGNYWDNYDGVDEYSGKSQNVPGSDGIGDTPCIIDVNNQDRYPLMNPWGLMLWVFNVTWKMYVPRAGWTNITWSTAAFTNSSITFFRFDKAMRQISFNVSDGTFCKIIIPKELLGGAFAVFIDGVPSTSIVNWDENHHFINFAFHGGSHEVRITGEIMAGIVWRLERRRRGQHRGHLHYCSKLRHGNREITNRMIASPPFSVKIIPLIHDPKPGLTSVSGILERGRITNAKNRKRRGKTEKSE